MYRDMGRVPDHLSKVGSSVKAVAELCRVPGQMPSTHRLTGASQVIFHIADHGVDPLEDPAVEDILPCLGTHGVMPPSIFTEDQR